MARITNLEIENVRCFAGRQSARTGRITLLVGENGTGKSTFLGCYNTVAKLATLHDLPETNHFDDTRFSMGTFDSIARRGVTDFTVGARLADHCHDSIAFTFRANDRNQPIDREMKLHYRGSNGGIRTLHFTAPEAGDVLLRVRTSKFSFDLLPGEISFQSVSTWLSRYIRHGYLPFGGEISVFRRGARAQNYPAREPAFLRFTSLLSQELPFPDPDALSVDAPSSVLVPRQREYVSIPDHLRSDNDSEFFAFLNEMGTVLGLWKTVCVEPSPNTEGMQVLVDTPKGQFNLMDVGYGVHSMLEVLGTLHHATPDAVILLQQPEVHVHPRAQAALAEWMVKSGRRFVIETHSDHVIDRFRICVMKELLAPEDLSIVYFESSADGTSSTIHSISVDPQGNLQGEPAGYRSFFLQESRSLLGFD